MDSFRLENLLHNLCRSINDKIHFLTSDIIRRSQQNMIASRAVHRTTAGIDRNAVCGTQPCILDARCDFDARVEWLFGCLVLYEFNLSLLAYGPKPYPDPGDD